MRPILVALAATSLLMSACDKKVGGQTVAVVNGQEITSAELNAELASAKLPIGDKTTARSQALQSIIERKLLVQEASNEGIDKSPNFLARQRRLTDDLLIGMLAERKTGTRQIPSDSELIQFEAAHPQMFAKRETWRLDQLRFHLPPSGPISDQIAKTKSLQELASVLRANNIVATPAQTTIDSSVVPQDIYAKIIALDPGEPFIIPVGTEGVASVIASRTPQPLSGNEAKAAAVNAITKQRVMKLLQDQLKTLRQSAKIEYQSGFGPPAK